MVSMVHLCLIFITQLLFISSSLAKKSSKPHALVVPVTKDPPTGQYLTTINQRTPLVPVKVTIDLGGQILWVDCEDYVSSSYTPAHCGSRECQYANAKWCISCFAPFKPGCTNNTCQNIPENTIAPEATSADVAFDVVSLQSTDGSSAGPMVSVPQLLLVCAPRFLLRGLANGVKGMAGLGRGGAGLPSQVASAFNLKRKFAICLGSSNGVLFFGDGPYVMLPKIEVSKDLIYTPLLVNPGSTAIVAKANKGLPSVEYFIGVKSIKVNEKAVSLNTTLLSIDKEGRGGTKISTIVPYTVLETSIYNAVTNAFAKELEHFPTVKPVAPFKLCYNSSQMPVTRVGPPVPTIDLVLQKENVFWRIFGFNSMVAVKQDILCLGFVDGGLKPRTSIVIGGHQIEDNLLEFDLARSRLGFSSSLLFRQTTCANFNFTSNA